MHAGRAMSRGVTPLAAAGEWAFLVHSFIATIEACKTHMLLYKYQPQTARGLQEAKIRDLRQAARSRSQRNVRRIASIPTRLSRGANDAPGPKPCAPRCCPAWRPPRTAHPAPPGACTAMYHPISTAMFHPISSRSIG